MREMRDRRIQVRERMTANGAQDPRNLTREVSAMTRTVPGIAAVAFPKQSGDTELGIWIQHSQHCSGVSHNNYY